MIAPEPGIGNRAALALAAIAAAGVSAALHLRAAGRGPPWQVYLFKPLTTSLLLASALVAAPVHGPRYQRAVAAGLTLSLAGDVCLMLPHERFAAGLAAFLLAHVAYLIAFTSGVSAGAAPGLLVPLLVAAAVVLPTLWSGFGRMRLPVLVYSAAILLMVWRAWARWWVLGTAGPTLAAAGATLFMASDTLLALNRFRRPFAGARAATQATYVVAQALIAFSGAVP